MTSAAAGFRTSPTVAAPNNPPSDEQMAEFEEMSVQPLIRRWLEGENLDGQFVELEWGDATPWAGNQKEAKVALLDVNGDGRKELAYQTGCATVGNCLFYVYRQDADGYKLILSADQVQRFKLRETKTNGFFDIETSAHGSANSGDIAVFKYDGQQYGFSECFEYEYRRTGKTDRNGQSIVAEKPTLSAVPCPT